MITSSVTTYFQTHLATLMKNCEAADAAVVATLDGRLCAEKQRGSYAADRAAVMGSSLMAIGDAIAKELNLGECDIIISENQKGIVLFTHITEDFVLVCITETKNGLGALLSWARRTASEIAKTMPQVRL